MVNVSFWKMHGLGNDYILVDNRDGKLKEETLGKIAQRLCRRRFSVGADGLLVLSNSSVADAKMRIFNADGSEAEMCGNGIRCFAKYCFEKGIVDNTELKIETLAGIKNIKLKLENGKVISVTVDMGQPVLDRRLIPVQGEGRCVNEELRVDDLTYRMTCVSVGNPHCVIFVNDVESFPVETVGPKIENHSLFPKRTNVEFVQISGVDKLKIRVWERGVGETLACGTGACAAVVAANLLHKVGDRCTVSLLGGDLDIQLRDDRIFMTGQAEKAFEGVIDLWVH